MLWARVQDDTALEIISFDPTGRFHPDVARQFVQVPSHVKPNAQLVDGAWVNPSEPTPLTPEQIAAQQAAIAESARQQLADDIRHQRNALLAETDWTQAVDVPQSTKDKWAAYRQALRDVPQQPGFPENVQWPEKPA